MGRAHLLPSKPLAVGKLPPIPPHVLINVQMPSQELDIFVSTC
jgi:hypothetical protein